MPRHHLITASLLLLSITLSACTGAEALRRKTGPEYVAETQSWEQVIAQRGEQGMWLVVRGYHAGDDVVAVATNAPLSHAVVLDKERGEVIEAIGGGVKVTPLAKLLRESHRLQLIRPEGWTPALGAEAVKRARTQVGKKYDFLGVVGAPKGDRWYCSELVAWSMGVPVNKLGPWHVLHPKDLHKKGALLFDSGARDGKPDAAPATSAPAEVEAKPAEVEAKPAESGAQG